jgi:putative membrane protein
MDILGVLVSIVFGVIISALVIWIVSKLNLGLSVAGFGPAIIAAIVIAVVGGTLNWLIGLLAGNFAFSGLIGAIVWVIETAIVLLISGRILPGLKVKGFTGALIAAIAIGAFSWLINVLV